MKSGLELEGCILGYTFFERIALSVVKFPPRFCRKVLKIGFTLIVASAV